MSGRPGAGGEGRAAGEGGRGRGRRWCGGEAMEAEVDVGVGLASLAPGRLRGRRGRPRLGREAGRGCGSRRQAW